MFYKFHACNILGEKFFNSLRHRYRNLPVLTLLVFIFSLLSFCSAETISETSIQQKWVGTWTTSPQLVEPANNPPGPGLSNNTLRQIVHVSIGGDSLRVRFSNEFSTSPVKLNAVHIAVSIDSSTIDPNTDLAIKFNGDSAVTIEPGAAITSDSFRFKLDPLSNVAITIYFGSTSSDVTGHPGSRTTSYLLTGNQVSKVNFSGAVQTEHWYIINTIDVKAPDTAAAVVTLGNSITDGRGSGINKQDRWPDELARRLQDSTDTQQVAVLNAGIGGNCVLGACLGPSALSRFQRDVLDQNGVKWLIILEGINDIGGSYGTSVAQNLINAYRQMIDEAHAKGIFVYGATLLPMEGSSYYSADHETSRETVNQWIRNSGSFDAVIDFDKALRDPADTLRLLPADDSGDHLHPSETGHRVMAEAVDLNLFAVGDSLVPPVENRTFYFEPECAAVGKDWEILADTQASNGKYVTVKPGIQSLTQAPTDSASAIYITFSVDTAGSYYVFGRLNCPTPDDDSFWAKMDNGTFEMFNGLGTNGWEWKKFTGYMLAEGEHTFTITYREDGAKLDKISISRNSFAPVGMGGDAENLCDATGVINLNKLPDGYELEQNYPNPFNPSTTISFSLPKECFVTLKVFDVLGREVATLVNENKRPGEYEVEFSAKGGSASGGNAAELSSGIYYYKLIAGNSSEVKKMILMK